MRQELGSLLRPRSVAVVGASDNPDSIGGRPIRYLTSYGYTGPIYPVNPKRGAVQGIPAYPSISVLPEAADLAVIATPAETVVDTIDACGRAGARACAILSSGFGELGDAGKDAEHQLTKIASQYGMRLLGPNCQGVANLSTGCIAGFSSCFGDYHLEDGHIAIVSQSGAVAGMLAEIQHAHPTGLRYWVSTGNESDLDVTELVEWVLEDPHIRVVEAYSEQITNPHRLAAAAAKGIRRGQSILMVKAATTQEGKKAAASHTGALAQHDDAVEAFLHQHGIVRAASIADISSLARIFATGRPVTGNRVAVVSNSGGLGVMMADRCRSAGLQMAALTESTIRDLRSHLPAFAAVENPIDVTAQLLKDPQLLAHVLPTLAGDNGVDIILVGLGMVGRGYDVATIQRSLTDAYDTSSQPLAVVWIGGQEEASEQLSGQSIPVFSDDVTCVETIARYVDYATDTVPNILADDQPEQKNGSLPGLLPRIPVEGSGFMSEHASKNFVRECGLPVVQGVELEDPEDAVTAAREVGYPVVAKLSSPSLLHKTEIGAVRSDLRTDDELRRAVQDILLVRSTGGLVQSETRLLVEKMAPRGLEVAVGGIYDPTFGPTVVVASGGTDVEVASDSQMCFPPLNVQSVERAIRRLRIFPMLQYLRGTGPLDAQALVYLVLRFAGLLVGNPRIREADLNPVFVLPKGQGVLIADALVRIEEGK